MMDTPSKEHLSDDGASSHALFMRSWDKWRSTGEMDGATAQPRMHTSSTASPERIHSHQKKYRNRTGVKSKCGAARSSSLWAKALSFLQGRRAEEERDHLEREEPFPSHSDALTNSSCGFPCQRTSIPIASRTHHYTTSAIKTKKRLPFFHYEATPTPSTAVEDASPPSRGRTIRQDIFSGGRTAWDRALHASRSAWSRRGVVPPFPSRPRAPVASEDSVEGGGGGTSLLPRSGSLRRGDGWASASVLLSPLSGHSEDWEALSFHGSPATHGSGAESSYAGSGRHGGVEQRHRCVGDEGGEQPNTLRFPSGWESAAERQRRRQLCALAMLQEKAKGTLISTSFDKKPSVIEMPNSDTSTPMEDALRTREVERSGLVSADGMTSHRLPFEVPRTLVGGAGGSAIQMRGAHPRAESYRSSTSSAASASTLSFLTTQESTGLTEVLQEFRKQMEEAPAEARHTTGTNGKWQRKENPLEELRKLYDQLDETMQVWRRGRCGNEGPSRLLCGDAPPHQEEEGSTGTLRVPTPTHIVTPASRDVVPAPERGERCAVGAAAVPHALPSESGLHSPAALVTSSCFPSVGGPSLTTAPLMLSVMRRDLWEHTRTWGHPSATLRHYDNPLTHSLPERQKPFLSDGCESREECGNSEEAFDLTNSDAGVPALLQEGHLRRVRSVFRYTLHKMCSKVVTQAVKRKLHQVRSAQQRSLSETLQRLVIQRLNRSRPDTPTSALSRESIDRIRCNGVLRHVREEVPVSLNHLIMDRDDERWIKGVQDPRRANEVPPELELGGLRLTLGQLATLVTPRSWLNDQVINAYLDLLCRKPMPSARRPSHKEADSSHSTHPKGSAALQFLKQPETASMGTHFFAKVEHELREVSPHHDPHMAEVDPVKEAAVHLQAESLHLEREVDKGMPIQFEPLASSSSSAVLRWLRRRTELLLPPTPALLSQQEDVGHPDNAFGHEASIHTSESPSAFQMPLPSTSPIRQVLIPINMDNQHWVLAVWDKVNNSFTLYDSLLYGPKTVAKHYRTLAMLRHTFAECYRLLVLPQVQAERATAMATAQALLRHTDRSYGGVPQPNEAAANALLEADADLIFRYSRYAGVSSVEEWDISSHSLHVAQPWSPLDCTEEGCELSDPGRVPLEEAEVPSDPTSSSMRPTATATQRPAASVSSSVVPANAHTPGFFKAPQQQNGSDCGVFVCLAAWCRSQHIAVEFPVSSSRIALLRVIMGMELWQEKLLPRLVCVPVPEEGEFGRCASSLGVRREKESAEGG